MLKPTVRNAVLAALSALAVVPTLAHATLVTTTSTTAFDVSNSVSDTLAGKTTTSDGAKTGTANTNMDTQKKATIAQFDKSLGVLTGATVHVASTYTQTTSVTVASGGSGANADGTYTATGTGSGTVKLGIPTGVTGASMSINNVQDSCSLSGRNTLKMSCDNGSQSQDLTKSKSVDGNALNSYVGSGSFLADLIAVSNSAETTSNQFAGTATTTSTIRWKGDLSATYSYLLHAAQSFSANAALTSLTLDFGDVYLGDAVASKTFSISNLFDTNRVGLKLTNIVETGDVNNVFSTNLSLFDNLAQGGSNNYTASFLATSLGNLSASYQLTLADANPDVTFASDTLGTGYNLTLNVKANVLQHAADSAGGKVPEPASLMLLGLGAAALRVSRKRRQA
jgi:hypothetical protein